MDSDQLGIRSERRHREDIQARVRHTRVYGPVSKERQHQLDRADILVLRERNGGKQID